MGNFTCSLGRILKGKKTKKSGIIKKIFERNYESTIHTMNACYSKIEKELNHAIYT